MTDTQITDHFYLSEVTDSAEASRKNIDNSLPIELYPAVKKTAIGMEKVRTALNDSPISINSWYRCLELNTALGSKPTSQHIKGEAVDFIVPRFGTPAKICKYLLPFQSLIRWDQLILEHTWIHISWNSIPAGVQRGQVLSLLKSGEYATGLTDLYGDSLKA
jgi:hypothetical protein